MPGSRCTCPDCDAVVRLAADVPAGKKITCPECDSVFRVPEMEDTGFDEERERRPRRRKQPESSGMKPVIVLLILAPVLLGVVGLVAGGGYLAWKLAQRDKEVAAVGTTKPNTNVPFNPTPPAGNPPANPPAGPNQPTPPAGATDVGAVAPEIEGEDLDGHRFKLSDYRGKVVVLDFWGHW